MTLKMLYTKEPEPPAGDTSNLQVPSFASYYPVAYAISKVFSTNSFIRNLDAAQNWADIASIFKERMRVRSIDRYPVDIVLGARAVRRKDTMSMNYPDTIPDPEA